MKAGVVKTALLFVFLLTASISYIIISKPTHGLSLSAIVSIFVQSPEQLMSPCCVLD